MIGLDQQDDEKALLLTRRKQLSRRLRWAGLVLLILLLGVVSGAQLWERRSSPTGVSPQLSGANADKPDLEALFEQVNPPDGYQLPAKYGDLGPRLLTAGVIDYEAFAAIYENSGKPLTPEEIEILRQGSEDSIVINQANAHFLLSLFWAVGLADKNSILTDGPIMKYSNGQIENFASTGGWTLATKPVKDLYASLDLIRLTPEQQARGEEVAAAVYRPCCDNSTLFPDCNHGMAMLGLLELMASQGATTDEMFEAAKYVNAFWFPQQTLETAIYLNVNEGVYFRDAEARRVVGKDFASGSGAAAVQHAIESNGLLQRAPGQQNGCSN